MNLLHNGNDYGVIGPCSSGRNTTMVWLCYAPRNVNQF